MTKSIIINYSEADESLLMAFFKRLKIKTQPIKSVISEEKDYGDAGVPQRVADNIIEGLKWIKKVECGEAAPLGSWEDLLAELKAEQAQEVEMG
jgi:hypothetical protein